MMRFCSLVRNPGSYIAIDDLNIKKVERKELRKRVSVLTSEPYVVSGTLRENLDPFKEYTHETTWEVLE